MAHVQPGTDEWAAMWAQVTQIFGDAACENDGEVWQYMGTWNGEHELRHRNLSLSAARRASLVKGGRVYYRFAPGKVGSIYH